MTRSFLLLIIMVFCGCAQKEDTEKSQTTVKNQTNAINTDAPKMQRNEVSADSIKLPSNLPLDLYMPPKVTVTDATITDGNYNIMGKVAGEMTEVSDLVRKNMQIAGWQQKIDMKEDESVMLTFTKVSTTVVYTINKQESNNLISIMYY